MSDNDQWDNWDAPAGVVLVPRNDIIEHTLTEECACDPETEDVARTQNGKLATRKFIKHNAMDGRK